MNWTACFRVGEKVGEVSRREGWGTAQTGRSPPVPRLILWCPVRPTLAGRGDPGAAAALLASHMKSHSKFTAEVGLEPLPLLSFGAMVFRPNALHSGSLPWSPLNIGYLVSTLSKGADGMGEILRNGNLENGLGEGEAL